MAGQATVTQPGGYIQTECKLWYIGHRNITISHHNAVQCWSLPRDSCSSYRSTRSLQQGRGTEADIAVGKLDSEFEVPGRPGIVFFQTTLDR